MITGPVWRSFTCLLRQLICRAPSSTRPIASDGFLLTPMKYKLATGNSVLRAYGRAAKRVADCKYPLIATSQDAGFIMPAGWPKGEGFQVFVNMTRFSEAKLKRKPLSGGLLA